MAAMGTDRLTVPVRLPLVVVGWLVRRRRVGVRVGRSLHEPPTNGALGRGMHTYVRPPETLRVTLCMRSVARN